MSDRFGADLGSAHGTIRVDADTRGVDQMARALVEFDRKSAGVGDGLVSGFGAGERAVESFGARIRANQDLLDGYAARAGAFGIALGAGLVGTAKLASDLNESISKTDQVFGESSDTVKDWSKDAARSMGLSERAFLDAASSAGLLFKQLELGDDVTAEMSRDVVQLGVDLGSLFNVASDQAQADIFSGLVGETEPLRKYGIILNETVVAQRALTLGLAETSEELTEQDKILARWSLIQEQGAVASGNFADTQGELANQSKIAMAALENAGAAIGAVFLPGVIAVAGVVTDVADAVSRLDPALLNVAGTALAAAAGFALVSAGGAKLISIGISTAETWGRVARAFGLVDAGTLAADLTDVGTAAQGADRKAKPLIGTLGRLAALGIVGISIPIAIDVLREGGRGGGSIADTIAHEIVDGIAGGIRAAGGEAIADALNDSVDAAEEDLSGREVALDLGFTFETVKGAEEDIVRGFLGPFGDVLPDSLLPNIDKTNDRLEQLGMTWEEVEEAAAAAGLSVEDWLRREAARLGLIDLSARATDTFAKAQDDLAESTDEATKSLGEQADEAIDAQRAQEALNAEIQRQENQSFLTGNLLLPFTRDAEDARAATEDFNASLDEMTASALAAIAGVQDIAPELDGIQTGFSEVGASAVEMALDLANADALDLTASQRQALGLAEFLGDVETSLARVSGLIDQNAGDMAMWQGRIDLVTGTVGGNTEELNRWIGMLQRGEVTQQQFNDAVATGALGPFAELDALYNAGAISLGEYNEAKEAAIFLIQRSAGALQDERAEQAKLLPDLAAYVRLHDEAAGAVNDLTSEQRGFLAALQSNEGALFLQQLQILAYLAAVGQIPESVVTEFVADASAASPIVKGIATDMGLIPDEVSTTIRAEDEASGTARDVRRDLEETAAEPVMFETHLEATQFAEELDDLGGRVAAFVSLDGTVVTITVDSEAEALAFAQANADALDGREVRVTIAGDDGPYRTSLDAIRGETQTPVDIPVRVDVAEAAADFIADVRGLFGGANDEASVAVTTTVVVDDEQARADVAAFVAEADTAFAEHQVLVLGVESDVAVADLQTFQDVLGAFSAIPVPPRVISIDTTQALADLRAFEAELAGPNTGPLVGLFGGAGVNTGLQGVRDARAEYAQLVAEFAARVIIPAPDTSLFRAEVAAAIDYIGDVGDIQAVATIEVDASGAQAAVATFAAALASLPAAGAAAAQGLVAAFGGVIALAGQLGAAGGANFAGSFAAAIGRGAGLAYQAAYSVALAAYHGILNALGISSPSRVAMDAASEITAGLVLQLRRDEGAAGRAAERWAASVGDHLTTGAASLAARSVLSDDRSALLASRGAASVVAGGGVSVGSISIPIHINGIQDPEAVKRAVYSELNEAVGRALSGGVS